MYKHCKVVTSGGSVKRSDVYATVERWTKNVRDLKVVRELLLVTSEGSELQTDGAEHRKSVRYQLVQHTNSQLTDWMLQCLHDKFGDDISASVNTQRLVRVEIGFIADRTSSSRTQHEDKLTAVARSVHTSRWHVDRSGWRRHGDVTAKDHQRWSARHTHVRPTDTWQHTRTHLPTEGWPGWVAGGDAMTLSG